VNFKIHKYNFRHSFCNKGTIYPNATVLPVPSDQHFPVCSENPNTAAKASCYLTLS